MSRIGDRLFPKPASKDAICASPWFVAVNSKEIRRAVLFRTKRGFAVYTEISDDGDPKDAKLGGCYQWDYSKEAEEKRLEKLAVEDPDKYWFETAGEADELPKKLNDAGDHFIRLYNHFLVTRHLVVV